MLRYRYKYRLIEQTILFLRILCKAVIFAIKLSGINPLFLILRKEKKWKNIKNELMN